MKIELYEKGKESQFIPFNVYASIFKNGSHLSYISEMATQKESFVIKTFDDKKIIFHHTSVGI